MKLVPVPEEPALIYGCLAGLAKYVSRAFSRPGVQIAALTPEIAVRSSHPPGTLHGDAADRMLVATAMLMGLKLMTRDRRILDYAAQGHLSVSPC